jgi:hypothetical protein
VSIIVIEHFLGTPQETPAPLAPPSSVAAQAVQTNQAAAPATEIAESEAQTPVAEPVRPLARDKPRIQSDAYLEGLDKKQVELRIKRTELLLKYTEQHPDVVHVDRELEQLRIERSAYLRKLKKQQKN